MNALRRTLARALTVALVALGCASASNDVRTSDDPLENKLAIDRKKGELGRCIGMSRVNPTRRATLVHAAQGTPPVVPGSVLTFTRNEETDARFVVKTLESRWEI